MVHTAVFVVIGIALLSLGESHPMPDHHGPRSLHADTNLRNPRVPLFTKDNDSPKLQSKQLGSLATALLLIPLISPLVNGLGGGNQGGILGGNQGGRPILGGNQGGILGGGGGFNRSPEGVTSYVGNIPGSSVPHLYVTQRQDNIDVSPPVLPAAPFVPPFVAPLEPPYASPMVIPLQHPTLVHGNVLPAQHFVSANQLFVPLLPSYEGTKDDVKPITAQNVEKLSIKSGVTDLHNN